MIRSFIALPLPNEARAQLSVVQQMLPLTKRVLPENFHVTLAFLGDQPEPVLEGVHDALSAIQAEPFTLAVSGLALFGGTKPRLVHAEISPNPALDQLQASVSRCARAGGVQLNRRRFRPHVTLSRDRPQGAALARLEHALADLATFPLPTFEVTEFALYRSTLKPEGATYGLLAVYPLAG